ncbi:MAG: hypothetical protein IPN93_12040 [Bacteroidetes bacterium]|nr:hypothetical protein [Bacteroidota bacterium]
MKLIYYAETNAFARSSLLGLISSAIILFEISKAIITSTPVLAIVDSFYPFEDLLILK